MTIFIVEDDINVIKILQKIIEDRELGELLGYSTDGIDGFEKINMLKPNIVLVDLFMPGKDGISLVSEAKDIYPNMQFIMVSQVSSKDMIGKAYQSGIEYYVYKPVNAIEVENVIKKVQERIKMNSTLVQIENLFNNNEEFEQNNNVAGYERRIKNIMHKIGIIGESGSKDIIKILKYLLKENIDVSVVTIRGVCSHFTNNPKSMEQRIRRTAIIGMANLANIGIEDYMNPIFVEYSNSLYNFQQIKREMDLIRGKCKKGGKINLKKFIQGMLFYCEEQCSENSAK